MPYSKLEDLPKNVTNPLPTAAQGTWMRAFNSAYNNCKNKNGSDCETVARTAAWVVVKKKWKKGKEGKWERKPK